MDMRAHSAAFDWFLLVSASSSRRIKAISDTINKELSKSKVSTVRIEGKNDPRWVLLDCIDVVVHIFHEQERGFYDLEQLWSDVPQERLNTKCLEKT